VGQGGLYGVCGILHCLIGHWGVWIAIREGFAGITDQCQLFIILRCVLSYVRTSALQLVPLRLRRLCKRDEVDMKVLWLHRNVTSIVLIFTRSMQLPKRAWSVAEWGYIEAYEKDYILM
jgi:hypothetical protein